jgi:undecaprenyl-diphosphatase
LPRRSDPPLLRRLLTADAELSLRLTVPSGPLRLMALIVAHSGDSPLWLVGAAAALILDEPAWRCFGVRVLAATLVGGITATLLKWIFRRGRPGESVAGLYSSRFDRHAFPSGHASRTGCMAVLLAPLLPGWGAGLLTIWAGLVSLARVALRAHYLSDVIAGLVLGALAGLALLTVL